VKVPDFKIVLRSKFLSAGPTDLPFAPSGHIAPAGALSTRPPLRLLSNAKKCRRSTAAPPFILFCHSTPTQHTTKLVDSPPPLC